MPKFLRETFALAAIFFLMLTGAVVAVAGLVSVWGLPFGVLYAALAVKGADALREGVFNA